MFSRGLGNCLALGFLKLLLLPVFFLVTRAQGNSIPLVYGLLGSKVRLFIPGLSGFKELEWHYKSDRIVNWNKDGPFYFRNKFYRRVTYNDDTSIIIDKLQEDDTDIYTVKCSMLNGKKEEKKIQLVVIDHVRKPRVKIDSAKVENKKCILKISCVVPTTDVTYRWIGTPEIVDSQQRVQTVILEENGSGTYTCIVNNPVSTHNNTVKHFPPCKTDRSSAVAWGAAWHTVMWPTVLLVLLT